MELSITRFVTDMLHKWVRCFFSNLMTGKRSQKGDTTGFPPIIRPFLRASLTCCAVSTSCTVSVCVERQLTLRFHLFTTIQRTHTKYTLDFKLHLLYISLNHRFVLHSVSRPQTTTKALALFYMQ